MNAPGPFDLLADPALPGLATALDPARMASCFSAGLRERTRGASPRVEACAVEEVYYRPGKHCGVLYRLRFDGPARPGHEEWLYARLLPEAILRERHERALSGFPVGADGRANGALDPVTLWEDPGMLVWAFPYDPKLSGLPLVADRTRVGERFALERALGRAVAGARSLAATPWRAGFERIKYMPCKRCVLRYHVTPEGSDAGSSLVFYAKAYPNGASAEAFRLQRAAVEALGATPAKVDVPEPIVHLAEESAIWFEDWGGRVSVTAARERGWDEMADRAAATISALHLVHIPGLDPAPGPERILPEILEDGATYAARVPAHRALMQQLLARFESLSPDPAADGPRVPIHGAFRAEHVLVRDGRSALLDLDGLADGDPLLDAAEYVASLEFLALSGADPTLDPARVSRRFLESYAARVPWRVDRERLSWYVLASVVRKMLLAVKRLARPALDRMEREGTEHVGRWLALGELAPVRREPVGGGPRPGRGGIGATP